MFPNDKVLNKTTIHHLTRKIHKIRNVSNQKHKKTLDGARFSFLQSSSKSLSNPSQQKNVPLGTAHKVTQLLKLWMYCIHMVHKMLFTNHAARPCHWLRSFACNNIQVLDITFLFNKVWFHLISYVNNQNSRFWSSENIHTYHKTQMHPVKIGMWYRVTGPVLF
jgi:hypothetical protein